MLLVLPSGLDVLAPPSGIDVPLDAPVPPSRDAELRGVTVANVPSEVDVALIEELEGR